MKKLIALIVCLLIAASICVPAYAAVPTALTFNEISAAPTLDGVVDAAYGSPVFDYSAKELKVGDKNLFMSDVLENGEISDNGTYGATDAAVAKFAKTYNSMRTVAYIAYDKNNLYLAFDTTDVAPKASSNSAMPWRSTNFQLCMYVNQRLAFFTVAYAGTNKVNIANDGRNEFDIDVMKVSFKEKSQSNFVYELVIPWSAASGLKSAEDVEDFRFGYVQTSMAEAYICTSVGEGWHQDYDKLVPVTLKALAGTTTGGSTASSTSSATDDTSAPTGGGTTVNVDVDVNNNEASDASSEADTTADASSDSADEGEEIIVEEEKDYTMIIILAVIAGVVLIGGVVAVILLNKKPSAEKTENENKE